MTMIFWDRHPSRMPFLPKHLESIVAHLFAGIADNLSVRPVDAIAVLALLYNESRFHPTVVSPAGAVGMAQFMPDTARDYGLTPTARPDLWFAFRDARAAYRQGRDERHAAFRSRHGGIAFSADAAIKGVAFSPTDGGAHLVVSSGDGLARVFVLQIEELLSLARSRVTRTFTREECKKYLHIEQCPSTEPLCCSLVSPARPADLWLLPYP